MSDVSPLTTVDEVVEVLRREYLIGIRRYSGYTSYNPGNSVEEFAQKALEDARHIMSLRWGDYEVITGRDDLGQSYMHLTPFFKEVLERILDTEDLNLEELL